MKAKAYLLLVFVLVICMHINSQVKNDKSVIGSITVDENDDKVEVVLPGMKYEVQEDCDTLSKITLGRKLFIVIEDNDDVKVKMERVPSNKFRGHWAGVYMGFCNYLSFDHSTSLPVDASFMDLNAHKSISFGINFVEYNIPLQQHNNNVGFVTGLGWAVNNYRFDSQIQLSLDDNGKTFGNSIVDQKVLKNKVTTSFLKIPFLFEVQKPAANNGQPAYLSAGVYGGLLLGSHTKIVYDNHGRKDISKSERNLNINPFQYGAMVQLGYKVIKLYATYDFSTFYEKNQGPTLYPYSIGIVINSF